MTPARGKTRGRPSRRIAGLCLALGVSTVARAEQVDVVVHPAIERPSTVFEGWGTALAWFANVTGDWPEADRARLADLLYGKDGLG